MRLNKHVKKMDAVSCQSATPDNPHLYSTVYSLAAMALREKPLQYPKGVFAMWVYYNAVDGKKPAELNCIYEGHLYCVLYMI